MQFYFPRVLRLRPRVTEHLPQPFKHRDVFMSDRYDLANAIASTDSKMLLKIIKCLPIASNDMVE